MQDVAEQPVAQVHDDPLADTRHQVAGRVRADALEEVRHQDERRHLPHVPLQAKDVVVNRLDEIDDEQRADGNHEHAGNRAGQSAAVRRRIAKQPEKLAHSVNRYLISTHRATSPSRQVIFFPSS